MTSRPLRVSDIMCKDFIVIDGMATISAALAKMAAVNADMVIVDKRSGSMSTRSCSNPP